MKVRNSWPTALVAAGAVAALLAGCAGGSTAEPGDATADPAPETSPTEEPTTPGETTTVSFWSWVPGIEDAVALFNETHDHIQVDFTRITSGDAAQIPHHVQSGTNPDIVQISQHSLPDFIIDDLAVDISAWVGDAEALFTASSWNAVAFGDAVFGIPQDSGPSALMYRADIFEAAGVAVPTTWAEYLEAARALRAHDENLYISTFSPNAPWLFEVDLWQQGGTIMDIDDDHWTVEIASDYGRTVAERWQTLLDEDLVRVSEMWTPEFWADFNSGKVASINLPAWMPLLVAENAPDTSGYWRIAPSPSDTGVSGDGGGAVNVVLRGAEDRAAAAAEFIVWLNSDPGSQEILIDQGGLFPVSLNGLESPALTATSEFFGGQDIFEVFIESALNASASNVPGPNYTATQARLQDAFVEVANGNMTFVEALETVAEQARGDLRQRGLSVR